MKTIPVAPQAVKEHFAARAPRYDRSSRWCTDQALMDRILETTDPRPQHHALDVACGTGLVSRQFKGRVARLVGLDFTEEMSATASRYLDELVVAPAESMPFSDNSFDIAVCRQGIQFMDAPLALAEMARVVRPGGTICLINLCAYGPEDRDEYFEILRLRNPARRNFFMRESLADLLTGAGCHDVVVRDYISVEDVDAWSDNGAIEEARREGIRRIYRHASPEFNRLHAVSLEGGRIVDHMLFGIASGMVR